MRPRGRRGASSSRSSTRRSAAGSCCSASRSRPTSRRQQAPVGVRGGADLHHVAGLAAFKVVMIISRSGQFFCGESAMTSASRMMFAFTRDHAIPGWQLWSKVTPRACPVQRDDLHRGRSRSSRCRRSRRTATNTPIAFFALTAITVIGLYIAYAIPIFLRWRMGDAFEPGQWTLGKQVQVDGADRVRRGRVHLVLFFCRSGPPASRARTSFTWDNATCTTPRAGRRRSCSSGLVAGVGPEVVQGADPQGRGGARADQGALARGGPRPTPRSYRAGGRGVGSPAHLRSDC